MSNDTPIQEIDKAIGHIVGQIQKTSQSDIIANLCMSVEKLIELRIKMKVSDGTIRSDYVASGVTRCFDKPSQGCEPDEDEA